MSILTILHSILVGEDVTIPAGIIVMWSGLIANIPAGWVVCDGLNGTPDWRGKFIKGANGEAGATGGAATHAHAGHSDHAVTQPGAHSNHVVTQPATHATSAAGSGGAAKVNSGTHTGTAVDAHSAHTGTAVNAHSAHNSVNHEPAYYEAIYIMKV